MQRSFRIFKSTSVIHHINTLKNKSCMAISIGPEKDFHEVQHPLMIKDSLESDCRGNLPQHNKGHIWQTHSWHHSQWWNTVSSKTRSKIRQGCPPFPPLLNILLEVLVMAIREEKEIKGIQIGKEVKLSLFPDDMILYIEVQKEYLKDLKEGSEVSERDGNTRPPDLPLEKFVCRSGSNS